MYFYSLINRTKGTINVCLPLCKTVPNCRFTILYLDAQNIINSDVKSAPLAHCDPSD